MRASAKIATLLGRRYLSIGAVVASRWLRRRGGGLVDRPTPQALLDGRDYHPRRHTDQQEVAHLVCAARVTAD